jgi:hypothetical protein
MPHDIRVNHSVQIREVFGITDLCQRNGGVRPRGIVEQIAGEKLLNAILR